MYVFDKVLPTCVLARLAQLVEHQTFNLRAKGSSPLSGESLFFSFLLAHLITTQHVTSFILLKFPNNFFFLNNSNTVIVTVKFSQKSTRRELM